MRCGSAEESGQERYGGVGEFEATIDIEALNVLEGQIPRRALDLVLDWAEIHRGELRENWERARARQGLHKILPLV